MLRKVFERYFRRERPTAKLDSPRLAYQVDGTLPPGPLPAQLMACVLRRGELIAVSRDAAPRVQDGELCWLLPADDVMLPIHLPPDDSPLAVDISVRFETDPSIAVLLRDRAALTSDELTVLVTSELSGLVDLLGHADATVLTTLDDEDRERLRAKLSLMLQTKGLRCTGLGEFRPAAVVEEPEKPAMLVDTTAGTGEEWPEPETERAGLEPVLAEVIGQVRSAEQWEELLEQIEASGMPLDDAVVDELDALGQSVVRGQIDAKQAARRVSELAEAARTDAGVVQPDLRHWQGLALRMRLLDAAEVERNSFRSTRSRRPWTWWMLRRTSVDQRLRQFLQDVVHRSRASLDAYRSSLQQISTAGSVKELSDRFRVVEDLLETVPTLVPSQRQYRLDGQQQKQAVQNIQRAVTAAELVQAATHVLSTQPEGTVPWRTALAEATSAIQALEDHLRARRQMRTGK